MARGLDPESLDVALASLRDFAKQRLPDEVLLDLDARDEMPLELVREMCGPELGLQLLFVPEEYGGMGAGAFDVYRICEALARIDLGVATRCSRRSSAAIRSASAARRSRNATGWPASPTRGS